MVLLEFAPSLPLSAFIRVYRVVHFVFDDAAKIPFKPYPPKPEHCLSFYPRDTEKVQFADNGKTISNLKTVIIGQQAGVTNRYVGRDFLVFQVVFSPGALYRLTGIPSIELNNGYIDAEAIFPNSVKEVNDKINDAKGYPEMVSVVEAFLAGRIAICKKDFNSIDRLSNLMLRADQSPKIEWLAGEACLSLRQFERKFMERMGVSPRYFNKVIRFENAFRMKNKYPQLSWFVIAIECGYYDYQHLVKDYQAFTQKTPIDFHALDLKSPERKFGEADTY
ncbi:helix-turn-helix domain-containing protein [Mucilaginibacter glaciei]|uniref:AraC family transcriptional regulator n=1 Tax=Mucilaginibacter glaciei TaxID=2772109 RepID=A0A926S3M6_9SPHI|nr:helix-turn-helix domain-containing protein [Mucilaginibacter glaciei]MBD1395082.1 AraC family transcriptional regulator [Mucilaginibacter glaciei]